MPDPAFTRSLLEWTAVLLNIGFSVCIAREQRMGWALGSVAGIIGTWLYAMAHTWAMAALNGYYIAMAVYGWWSWGMGREERITRQRWTFHALVVPAGLLLAYGMSEVLGQWLNGHFPRLDAFVTVFSLIATWMMARKYITTWLYFIVADSASVWLNWRIGYPGYTALNGIYLVISVVGLLNWGKLMARQEEGQVKA